MRLMRTDVIVVTDCSVRFGLIDKSHATKEEEKEEEVVDALVCW